MGMTFKNNFGFNTVFFFQIISNLEQNHSVKIKINDLCKISKASSMHTILTETLLKIFWIVYWFGIDNNSSNTINQINWFEDFHCTCGIHYIFHSTRSVPKVSAYLRARKFERPLRVMSVNSNISQTIWMPQLPP